MAVGGFHWTMDFTWINRPLEPGKSQADPLTPPTIAGGLFAVDRLCWGELGGHDYKIPFQPPPIQYTTLLAALATP